MTHQLKTHPEPFKAVIAGIKTFEFRKNDRDFKLWDFLILDEYDPDTEEYTGETIVVYVTYILTEGFGIPEGYCIMSIIHA